MILDETLHCPNMVNIRDDNKKSSRVRLPVHERLSRTFGGTSSLGLISMYFAACSVPSRKKRSSCVARLFLFLSIVSPDMSVRSVVRPPGSPTAPVAPPTSRVRSSDWAILNREIATYQRQYSVSTNMEMQHTHQGNEISNMNGGRGRINAAVESDRLLERFCKVGANGITALPTFMPVATQAALKGLTQQQTEALGVTLIFKSPRNNTYHLSLRPGTKVLDAAGGAHKFQGWRKNMLTDSGGFQMIFVLMSDSSFSKVTEEGVLFESPFTGEPTMLTPEESMAIQHSIGADVMMQLDDVVSSLTTGPRVEE
ncbi:unnamed protein product, partial [Rhizoctonia solani]